MQKTKIIAHRGASNETPENTLAAIKTAIDLNVDCIEIDVHLSKDHVPVVIHDETVERTTSSKKKQLISQMTLKEIKAFDAGSWYHSAFKNESIPTLKEILELDFKNSSLMIEIKKSPYIPHLVMEKIFKTIELAKPSHHIILGSFETDLLNTAKAIDPTLDLIYIVDKLSHLHQYQGQRLAIWEKLLSPQLIKQLKEENKEIWTFTIDSPKRAKELKAPEGVAGIITNNPRLMKKILS